MLLDRLADADPFFDEGTYLLSLKTLRHGQALGADVFASQPPGFYDLLRVLTVAFPATLHGLRAAMVASVLLGTLAAFVIGRRLVGWAGGVGAAACVLVTPPLPLYGARVFADTPAMTLATCALAASTFGGLPAAAATGALLIAAISVKLSAVVVTPAAAIFLLRRPDGRRALIGASFGGAAVLLTLLSIHWRSAITIWHEAITYHVAADSVRGGLSNAGSFVAFFNPRTPFLWLLLLGAAGTLLAPARVRLLWLWSATAGLFVLTHRPLHENHLLTLPFAFAVPAGTAIGAGWMRTRMGPIRVVATGAIAAAIAAGYVQQFHRVDSVIASGDPQLAWAARMIDQRTAASDLVVSDEPIVTVLADRRTPGNLVDTAILRFETGSLTDRDVESSIVRDHIRVVVAGRSFRSRPKLMRWVARRFPETHSRGDVTVRLRR